LQSQRVPRHRRSFPTRRSSDLVHAPLACNAGHAHAMAMSIYIDTHTHLDFPDFDHDREAVLTDCERLGVRRLLLMGVTVDNWDRIWDLTSGDERLYAAFGLHPVFLEQHRPEHLEQLRARLTRPLDHPRGCAVGEFGLDYFIQDADREAQQQLFEAQLALAADFALPVLLHVRRAHAPTIATLKRYRLARGGIIHAFSGSLEEAREY